MEPVVLPGGLFNAGPRSLERGQAEPAIAAWRRCLPIAPGHSRLALSLATALQARRDFDANGGISYEIDFPIS
jgi:hypothetical protein